MKKQGILNSHISKVLADMGHTDMLVVADCGLPIPAHVNKIDLALSIGIPSFLDVVKEVIKDMEVEKVTVATEIEEMNPVVLAELKTVFPTTVFEFVTHEEFKQETTKAKAIIRTGEATPYANILLHANVIF